MSSLKILNGKLSEFPTFPIFGNVDKDEEFYIASIVYPYNLKNDQTILNQNIQPRLYFISIPTISLNDFGYIDNSVYPYPPTSCNLAFQKNGQNINIPPFSSTDFILSENIQNPSTFISNYIYSKNVSLKLKNNNILSNIVSNSVYIKDNNIYTDLFSTNSIYKYNSIDLYSQNNLLQAKCNELYNFVFIPKNENQTYIQGLLYTGIPLIIYYGSKNSFIEPSKYYPMHARYSLTCKNIDGCKIPIIPTSNQLNNCYNDYNNGDVNYICNLDFNTSNLSSNDIIKDKVTNTLISNDNEDFLNYYIIPKYIYDRNGIKLEGLKVIQSYFNYLIGKQSDYVVGSKYYTKIIINSGIPKNDKFEFKYCTNDEYMVKNINGYGCYNCFSISRNPKNEIECQCIINKNKVDSFSDIVDTNDFYTPTKTCTKYKDCYCNFPQKYMNDDGFIYCGNDICKNCACDDQDITKRCPLENCSYYDLFVEDDFTDDEINNNKLILWILIGIGSFLFILFLIFIINNLRKKDISYQKQNINIEIK